MKTTLILALILCAPLAHAMVIQEIYPNPVQTETGGEAVLLYNNDESALDISGWTLGTPSSATDATIPAGTTINSHQLYLVADAGWSTSKDDASWANANHEEAITLVNGGGTVSLHDGSGSVVDSISYPVADDGIAYWREGNSVVPTDPLFSAPLDALYTLHLSGQSGSGGAAGNITITDNGTAITSVLPTPGGIKYITIDVVAATEPTLTIFNTTYAMELVGAHKYTADVGIGYSTPPGNYLVQAGDLSTTLNVLPLLAVDCDAATLDMGVSTQHNFSLSGDDDFGIGGPTLRNIGNVPLDISMARTTLLRNSSKVNANMSAIADEEAISVTNKATHLTTLAPMQTAPLSLTVTVPESAASGDYATSLALQLKKA